MCNTRESLSLNGDWEFIIDPLDHLQVRDLQQEFGEKIQVPGSWEEQGAGTASGHYPIGAWKKKSEYTGKAWYGLTLRAGDFSENQTYRLVLSGVHWSTEVWLDGSYIGSGESLVTEHSFDITPFFRPGQAQKLLISVDNRRRLPLIESHIHSYHTATNWGGITGGVRIEAYPASHIEQVSFHQEEARRVQLHTAVIFREDWEDGEYLLEAVLQQGEHAVTVSQKIAGRQQAKMVLEAEKEMKAWTDESPHLCDITVTLLKNGSVVDQYTRKIGLRSFRTSGQQFVLNEKPVFLSGYVDCCVFPQTGYPHWDKAEYQRQFETAKAYGFNHVRLHGWSAPMPFWEAADETGMLVQTELPHWSLHYLTRDTPPPEEVQQFLLQELRNIIQDLSEHPSFVMMAMGNELISAEGHPSLNEMVELARRIDPWRLYTDNTGFGQLPENDREGDFFIQSLNWHPPYELSYAGSPDTREDYRELPRLTDKPLIGHEHGQFTMYADPALAAKFHGNLKPGWLDILNESLESKGLQERVPEFQQVTGTHMVRSYKEIMERARRTQGLSGVQLLDIRDFPGQGHATTGILDCFWDSKGAVDADCFRAFNNHSVLLMRNDRKTFYAKEQTTFQIELSHFGSYIAEGKLNWRIEADQKIAAQGEWENQDLNAGSIHTLGTISFETLDTPASAYQLIVTFTAAGERETLSNQWEFWSYQRRDVTKTPEKVWTNMPDLPSALYGVKFEQEIGVMEKSYYQETETVLAVTDEMTRDVLQYMIDGGSVWLMAKNGNQYDEVTTAYLPVFWNYLWFPTQGSTTMGMIIHGHPLFQHFPHDGASNWQWYHLTDGAAGISLDNYPQLTPIIEVVDNFHRMKRLAYAFEAKVGRGKLFVSSLRTYDMKDLKRPETQGIFHDVLSYLQGEDFQPEAKMSLAEVMQMFKVGGGSVT